MKYDECELANFISNLTEESAEKLAEAKANQAATLQAAGSGLQKLQRPPIEEVMEVIQSRAHQKTAMAAILEHRARKCLVKAAHASRDRILGGNR